MGNDRITLITKIINGAEVDELKTELFAEKKPISFREFYAAQQVGIVPRHIFAVDLLDYESTIIDGQEPTEVIYKSRRFVIKRQYEKADCIELTVEVAT